MKIKVIIGGILIIGSLFAVKSSYAQTGASDQRKKLFGELPIASSDTVKARSYLKLALYFLDINPTNKNDLDSADRCIKKASSIMLPYHQESQFRDIRLLEARTRIKYHDPDGARQIFMELINGYAIAGKKNEAGRTWLIYGIALFRFNQFSPEIVSRGTLLLASYLPIFMECMEKAAEFGIQARDKRLQARVCAQLASYYMASGAFDEAEKQVSKLAVLQKASAAFKPYEITYVQAMLEFLQKKDMVMVTSLALATVRNAAEIKCEADARSIYILLGRAYKVTGDKAAASDIYQKYMDVCRETDQPPDPLILNYYISILLLKNKGEALRLVQLFDPEDLHNGSNKRFTIAKSYAQVYVDLGQFENAKRYFDLALKIATESKLSESDEFQAEFGKFYFIWGKYEQARTYFEATINSKNPKISPNSLEIAHHFLFRIDSAEGDYRAAYRHFKAVTDLKDTLQNQLTRKNIAELNIQYETAKKQKDIELLNSKIRLQHLDSTTRAKGYLLLKSTVKLQQVESANKEKSIELLNSQVKIERYKTADKEKNILVLTGKTKLQVSELKRERTEKNLIITGSGLLLIIMLLLFNQFRISRRNNAMISKSNESLQHLLRDKETLMTEIHHRVKNNLQMVLSLLESQSAYLTDEALVAIRSSYNRVLAMSLIHQKLYISENTSTIDMSEYLWELVTYLQESFGIGGQIVFEMNLSPITLDITQAVPLGLIVNESVTNSIKYAFPGNRRGNISIEMKETIEHLVCLQIRDNGVGLPPAFDETGNNSLGMRLIKGLSDNLEAKLTFEKKAGTGLIIEFRNCVTIQKNADLT
jgi:two-component sensor histidine kinase